MKMNPRLVMVTLIVMMTGVGACHNSPADRKQTADDFLPPPELIAANVRDTDISVDVRLQDVAVDREPSQDDIYGEWKITAEVLKTFKGNVKPGQTITYFWRFEQGIKAPQPGSRHLASLKLLPDRPGAAAYVVPDNGYHFPYDEKLEETFKRASESQK